MDPRNTVKVAYDKIGSAYQATRRVDTDDIKHLHQLTDRLSRHATILDAGCGSGYPVTKLLAENYQITGVDFSLAQAKRTRTNVPEGRTVCADLTKLPFRDSSFDAIVSYYALIHIPREEHRNIVLSFQRILKPTGLALLCMGAGNLPDDTGQYLGTRMFWSHYDKKTNLEILAMSHLTTLWSDIVRDPIDPKAAHLFVLAQKS